MSSNNDFTQMFQEMSHEQLVEVAMAISRDCDRWKNLYMDLIRELELAPIQVSDQHKPFICSLQAVE